MRAESWSQGQARNHAPAIQIRVSHDLLALGAVCRFATPEGSGGRRQAVSLKGGQAWIGFLLWLRR
jgi:hypothetical protein